MIDIGAAGWVRVAVDNLRADASPSRMLLGMREIPAELLARPFTTSQALAAGVTKRQLQGRRFVRLLHDVHVVAGLEITITVRADAVSLVLPPGGVVAGVTGAWLHGADIRAIGDLGVDAVVARLDQFRRRGVRGREALVEPDDVVLVGGVPVLSPTRIAFDLARQTNLVEAVVGVDAMLNRGGADLAAIAAYITSHPRWRGVRYAEETLCFVEPLSQSPMESRQRMALVLAGLPRPEAQIELFAGAILMAVLDNGYRLFRIGTDYDGEPHAETWQRDADRQEWIREQDWWHRRYNALCYRAGWRPMIKQVGGALIDRGWRPGDLPCCPPANLRRVPAPYGSR